MSYNNVITGKLKLKGKALDVKAGGMKKKKKKSKESVEQKLLNLKEKEELDLGSDAEGTRRSPGHDDPEEQGEGEGGNGGQLAVYEDHRTPAEKKYDEQRMELETRRLAKVASKSHRQKIEEFNQYLANLSEHYDIPKVGPG